MSDKEISQAMKGKTVRLPIGILEEIESEAQRHRWSTSQLIRIVLEDWAKRNRKKRAGLT